MNKHLYVFNPDHDLALANQDVNYMAPRSARQMARDLALLPIWYAQPGSFVLAHSAYNGFYLDEASTRFEGLPVLLTEPEVEVIPGLRPDPWGWDPAITKRLSTIGIHEDGLPSVDYLKWIRKMSHRSFAIELLDLLIPHERFCGESFYYSDIYELRRFVESRRTCVLKSPISGSGKGLYWSKGRFTPHMRSWCEKVIERQGGVIIEPVYNKVNDFAMQFYACEDGSVKFAGYSLFQTGMNGAYEGNRMLSDESIEQIIAEVIPLHVIHELRQTLEEELQKRIGGVYTGYLGVDMMLCRFREKPLYRIHPCVEVNLRMTMGMTARCLYDRHIRPGANGVFKVSCYSSLSYLLTDHFKLTNEHPLRVIDGKVISGYMPLTPVTRHSQNLAYVLIDKPKRIK